MQMHAVPATPSVIAWTIRESGYSLSALATLLGRSHAELEGWIKGEPLELADLEDLAKAVERPLAAFFLPEPPESTGPAVKFRSLSSANGRALNPEERRRIREAARLQEVLSWITREMRVPIPDVPHFSTKRDASECGEALRLRLGVSLNTQFAWKSSSEALRGWREAIEILGVTVLMFPMGEEACRGFSIWDDFAPLVAINTAWLPEARLFTLFHELAHLATRTNSACAEDAAPRSSNAGDRTERWCERVAAAALMPAGALQTAMTGTTAGDIDLSTVSRIATQFRVSRRAAALRLIESQKASWPLFRSIPPHSDRQQSGGGGSGLNRIELRRQRYGGRTIAAFREALRHDVIGAADVADHLGLPADALRNGAIDAVGQGD
jgi:Zn-dependent peptidase ImmA (M78 family)